MSALKLGAWVGFVVADRVSRPALIVDVPEEQADKKNPTVQVLVFCAAGDNPLWGHITHQNAQVDKDWGIGTLHPLGEEPPKPKPEHKETAEEEAAAEKAERAEEKAEAKAEKAAEKAEEDAAHKGHHVRH